MTNDGGMEGVKVVVICSSVLVRLYSSNNIYLYTVLVNTEGHHSFTQCEKVIYATQSTSRV